MTVDASAPLLALEGLEVAYGGIQAVRGIDLVVGKGELVCLIGANGAGKTTTLKGITGLQPVSGGTVRYEGEDVTGAPAFQLVRRGLAMVPEGRRLFPSLSVEENLLIGAHGRKVAGPWTLEAVYGLFPILRERRRNPGTALSGGQQQMVAIGRALMSNPRVILCDELSLGLAPVVIRDIYAALPRIRDGGASVIIVEQDIGQALKVADRVYCMMEGRVTLSGRPADLSRAAIHNAYFGATA